MSKRKEIEAIERLVAEQVGAVEHLEAGMLRPMLDVLNEAKRELQRDLRNWIRTVEDPTERFTAHHMRVMLRSLEGAIDKLGIRLQDWIEHRPLKATALERAAIAGMRANVVKTGELAVKSLDSEIVRLGHVFGQSLVGPQLDVAAVVERGDRLLWKRFPSSAARYAHNTAEDLRFQISVGVARGETFEQLVQRMRRIGGPTGPIAVRGIFGTPGAIVEDIPEGLFRRYRHFAERFVRTEMMSTYNTMHDASIALANKERSPGSPKFLRRCDETMDGRTCAFCMSMHGKILRDGEGPPWHANCFPAGTMIESVRGRVPIESIEVGDYVLTHRLRWRRVTGLSRQHATGDLVALHSGRNVTRSTPNHPFAAEGRWIEANALDVERDRVWILERVTAVAHDEPAAPNERPLLDRVGNGLAPMTVPLAAVDLDRDATSHKSDIDVVHMDGEINGYIDSDRAQRIEHATLVRGLETALVTDRALPALGNRMLASPGRAIGGHGLGADLLGGHAAVAPSVILGVGSHNVMRPDDALDRLTAASEVVGERVRGLACEIHGNDQLLVEINSLTHAHKLMPVSVSRQPFDGDVFNFAVDEDESYIADGFVVHNCRGVTLAWRADWPEP